MPPPGMPRPDQPTIDAFVSRLEAELDRAADSHPNPGRTESLHRLNRAEYQNAIRDLLALDIDVASLLPADDADIHGFDNIAGLLSVSPALLERYMSAARKVSRLALGMTPAGPVTDTYTVPDLAQQDGQISEELPFGSRGGLAIHHYFPVDGEYLVKIRLRRQIYDYITGLDQPERLEVRVDGERVKAFKIGGEDHGRSAPQSFAGDVLGEPGVGEIRPERGRGVWKCGSRSRRAGTWWACRSSERSPSPKASCSRARDTATTRATRSREQGVESVAISGPFRRRAPTAPRETPSRREILVCRPARSDDEEACAKKILSTLARRAYRRPVTDAEVQTLVGFYKTGSARGRLRRRHPVRARTNPRRPELPVPRRARSGRTSPRARSIASATWSWPPVCRSSCGAAFRTRSCSTSPCAGS